VVGLDDLLKKVRKMPEIQYEKAIRKAGIEVMVKARELAPKDTLNLVRSIFEEPLFGSYRKGSKVYTVTEYAPYQEFGTVKMKAQPFMFPAISQLRDKILKDIGDWINKELAKFGK